MATLNQIAASYCDAVDKPFDMMLRERVKFSIKYWRAKLIRQDFERNPPDRSVVQSIVLPMASVDAADSCLVVAGCKLLRTQNKVPRPVVIKGSQPFFYVGPVVFSCDDNLPFSHATRTEIEFARYKNLTANNIRYMYFNDYIYVTDCLRQYIRADHPFEDPFAAMEACIDGGNCVDDDTEFPISGHMLDTILRGLQTAELRIMTSPQEVTVEDENPQAKR